MVPRRFRTARWNKPQVIVWAGKSPAVAPVARPPCRAISQILATVLSRARGLISDCASTLVGARKRSTLPRTNGRMPAEVTSTGARYRGPQGARVPRALRRPAPRSCRSCRWIVPVGDRVFQSSVLRLTDRRHAREKPRSRPRLSLKAVPEAGGIGIRLPPQNLPAIWLPRH